MNFSAFADELVKIATSEFNHIPGGLAAHRKPWNFDQRALAKGIKVEMEHTTDAKIALEIAMDHLVEDPSYYDKLEKIEK